jgi:uncharacterized protein
VDVTDLEDILDLMVGMNDLGIAFSGGRDSTLVALAAARSLGDRAVAFTISGEVIPRREIDEAISVANEIGIRHTLMEMDFLGAEEFSSNPVDRCGFCKRRIIDGIRAEASRMGVRIIADGAVIDDLSDYRPGHIVATEMGVWHPLIEAGITKSDVRDILKKENISIWNKYPSPCLATRIPYGESITSRKIELADAVENRLRDLKFKNPRCRIFGSDHLAGVIEVEDPARALELFDEISGGIGGIRLSIDPLGYRPGSLNEERNL